MATRQYIGARYVPRFFENTSGTSDWRANTQYEPLTIVTRNGNSYTSKIPVPASVGAPENNPEYWVSTGLYNAQVQQLQENIDALQTESRSADEALDARVDVLEQGTTLKRRYILIGDSYGRGVVGPGVANVNGWTYFFKQFLNLSNDDCTIACADGAGFIGLQTTTFLDLLQSANAPEPNTITDIIVAGGRNDLEGSNTAIRTAMSSFYNTAKSLYPNAIVSLCFCGCYWNRENNNIDKLHNVRNLYAQDMRFKNLPQAATYMSFMSASVGGTDATHFNEDGYKALGRWIATCAIGGKPELEVPFASYTVTPEDGVTIGGAVTGRICDGKLKWLSGGVFNIQLASGVQITAGTPFLIGSLGAPFYGGYSNYSCSVAAMANIKYRTGGFITGMVTYQFKQQKLYINVWNGNPNSGGFIDLTDVSSIAMQPGLYEVDAAELLG